MPQKHRPQPEQSEKKHYMNTILVGLLIVAAFLIGNLWTSVQYLKKGYTSTANNQPTTGNIAQPTPTVAPVGDSSKVPPVGADDWVFGDRNAPVALIEYSDFECPFCKSFHPTAHQTVDAYNGKVMWVYRHFPLPFHKNAQKEAEASECVAEQGGNEGFWKFADAVYERTTSGGTGFALEKLAPLAKELGFDDVKFQVCLDSGKYTKKVQDQEAGGQTAGVNGTPGNIVLNIKSGKTETLPGAVPLVSVKTAVDKVLGEN